MAMAPGFWELDDASLDDATFPHALEWALRLNLPLRVVALTAGNSARGPVSVRLKAWGLACAQRGVSHQTDLTRAQTQRAVASPRRRTRKPAVEDDNRKLREEP
jgi:hypothetical protein